MLERTMSLRPAQALVAESSRFSLRTFFEAKEAVGEPMLPLVGASSAPVQLGGGAMPALVPSTLPPLSNLPKLATKEHNRFTFNGLVMPSSAQATYGAAGAAGGLSPGAVASAMSSASSENVASENLRLKAQTHTLNEKVAQLTTHLASTSESVMRGNKALVAERAQFHAQYASLAEKLKEAQALLVEAQAAPENAVKNAKLLTSKVLELQAENDRLSASTGGAAERYASLAAQHSVLLEKHAALDTQHEEQSSVLAAARAEVTAAQALSEACRVEAAKADFLVDSLDAKLAEARTTGACGGTHAHAHAPVPAAVPEAEAAAGDAAAPNNDKALATAMSAVGQGDAGGWPSTTGNPSGGGRSNNTTGSVALPETALPETAPDVAATIACPKTLRCEEMQRVANEAKSYAEMCCCNTEEAEVAQERHGHLESLAKRAWSALATGNPETATAVHVFSDPMHEDAAQTTNLVAHIMPTSFQRGAHYEDRPLCGTSRQVGSECQVSTAQARTNSYIEAVSRDLKLSMDASQLAYANSMKTGVAMRV